ASYLRADTASNRRHFVGIRDGFGGTEMAVESTGTSRYFPGRRKRRNCLSFNGRRNCLRHSQRWADALELQPGEWKMVRSKRILTRDRSRRYSVCRGRRRRIALCTRHQEWKTEVAVSNARRGARLCGDW